jgi:ABC-2 type transport system ATP-binding protein
MQGGALGPGPGCRTHASAVYWPAAPAEEFMAPAKGRVQGVDSMETQSTLVVAVKDLVKQYPGAKAVDGISFEVRRGEILGMVGPNGAGKTTTIECLEGLRRPDGGTIQVLGLDPIRDRYGLRERIGVQFQSAALPDRIKVWEALDLFSAFYPHPVDWEALLLQMGLAEKRDAYFSKLSGGQKQRVFIALALVNKPELAFLDELTTGLDPQARRAMWDEVRSIREGGTTVFLTTHFMEEAERLCDRVAILDHGKIVALDTPQNLIDSLGAEHRVVFEVDGPLDEGPLRAVAGVVRIERIGERVVVYGQKDGLVSGVVNALEAGSIRFENLRTEQPTLEDVFLALTGKEMRD